ncbi:MAG: signal peptide peptidase SppA [Candidatus Zixiibacteriota bacterium]
MAARRDWLVGIIIGGTFLVFALVMFVAMWGMSDSESTSFGGFGKRVAVVELIGEIQSSRSIVRQVRRWSEDHSVPVILLRVDSPGGGVAASQEIYAELLRARDKGKRIVVSMGSIAASGGLYVSMAADTIVANPGTLTGSIGVIFQFPTLERLLDKIGVRYETVKSGPYKDIGNLARTMTPADSAHLQSVIDDSYDQFVEVVAKGRRLSPDSVRLFADGRIFTGRQAKDLQLVDVLGDYEDALDVAADMAHMSKPPKTVRETITRRRSIWDLLGSAAIQQLLGRSTDEIDTEPNLQYRYN